MTKALFIPLFLLSSLVPYTALCTDIGGNITSNTTLTAANSPYIVISSLIVNTGVTLTVQSGVQLKFNPGVALSVEGTLNATGATFTSSDVTPVRGSWANITFGNSTTVGASTITSSSFLYGSNLYVSSNYTLNFSGLSTVSEFSGSPLTVNAAGIANLNNSTFSQSNNPIGVYGTANFSNNCLIDNLDPSNSGIILYSGSLTLANTNISNCASPLSINGPATLNISGTTNLAANTGSLISINFNTLTTGTFNLPTANVPYIFPSGFTVNNGASLTVASKNILKFQLGYGLYVDGILSANAPVGEAIYFTSIKDDNWGGDSNGDAGATSPARADWVGVRFNNTSVDASCVLRRAQIRYATNGVETDNANPTIDLCDFSINNFGLSMLNASKPGVTGNTFGSSSVTPIAMSFEADPTFTNNTFSFSDNTYDAIGLYGGTLTANATVKVRSVTSIPNVTYVILDHTTVPAGLTLTINAGVVIKSATSTNFQVYGTMLSNGTLGSPVVFTSVKDDNYGNPFDTNKDGSTTSPSVGDFGSITIWAPSTGNVFNYCKIRYANGNNINSPSSNYEYFGASLNFINAGGTVSNCEIKDVSDGINCFLASNPIIQNNQFTNMGFAVTLSAAANPTLTGNTMTNVNNLALGLVGVGFGSTELAVSGTIRKKNFAGYTNITYVLRNTLRIANGTNVNIEPGVVIKSTGYGFLVNGGFKTDGTAASNVIFSSVKDDNVGNPLDTNGDGNGSVPTIGEGPGIYFGPGSDDVFCKLLYLKMYYGQSAYSDLPLTGVIRVESANPVIGNVLVQNFASEGIGVYGNGAPSVSNVTFVNGRFPVSMSLLSNPTFTGITLTSMGYSAILINDVNLTSNATLAPRSFAGFSNIAYFINQPLTINSGAKFTIQPGVVVKIQSPYSYYYSSVISVKGSLVINGTAANKVIFTDDRDDSAGGDSNNDGNTTFPGTTGTWPGISFEDESVDADNKILYAEIRFASGSFYNLPASIQFTNSGGLVDHVVISFGTYGLGAFGTANPTFQNISLENLTAPVRMDMFASPTFSAITGLNIAVMGIHIPATTYSQNATLISRTFAGYTNITYVLEGPQTVNLGTTLTIPAGMTFKSNYYGFIVNGKLNVNGTAANKVVFTTVADDQYGNPADIQNNGSATLPVNNGYNWLNFPDVADDNSSVTYCILRYQDVGIACLSSSPAISNCTFSKCNVGISLLGTAAPGVNNNSFADLTSTPILTTIISFPSTYANNTISGTTFKGIGIVNETLSQDVTLPKRNFGGFNNIPYLFTSFTIGTTATLTIAPGVTTKWNGGTLYVQKGLMAQGDVTTDKNIIFTSWKDDFYGGDLNSDGNASIPSSSDWGGIQFQDVSLDPLCKLKNCYIRYAQTGISAFNASPDIRNTAFIKCNTDIEANGSSNPFVDLCDFYDIGNFGINNVNQSFIIKAENSWWGEKHGPTHSTNPTGLGAKVSDKVDFSPFRSIGPNVPIAGDVTQNGTVSTLDASKISQFLSGQITLTTAQKNTGDVTGDGTLSTLDASLIAQYAVGNISGFASEAYFRTSGAKASLSVGNESGKQGALLIVPVTLSDVENIFGSFVKIKYDTTYLEFSKVTLGNIGFAGDVNSPIPGTILLATYGTSSLNSDATIAYLHLKIRDNAPNGVTIPLIVENHIGNETNLTSLATNGSIKVSGVTGPIEITEQNKIQLSPNPAANYLKIRVRNTRLSNPLVISVVDIAGRQLIQKLMPNVSIGDNVEVNLDVTSLPTGLYTVVVHSAGNLVSKKFIVAR